MEDTFVCGFIDVVDDDEFLLDVVQEILDGARKPSEIARALNVPVEDVYNARKRLRRRLEKYQDQYKSKQEVKNG